MISIVWKSTLQNKAISNSNKSRLGSRYVYIYTYVYTVLNYLTIYYMYIYIYNIYIYTIYDVKCRRGNDANIPTYHLKSVCWNCVLFCLPTPQKIHHFKAQQIPSSEMETSHSHRWPPDVNHRFKRHAGWRSQFQNVFKIKLRSIHTPSKQAVLNQKEAGSSSKQPFSGAKMWVSGKVLWVHLYLPNHLAISRGSPASEDGTPRQFPGSIWYVLFWAMNHETGNRPPRKTKKKYCVCRMFK